MAARELLARAREWVMLGRWAVSDVAKYLRRDSLFEAAARIETVREHGLRLFAAARGVPFPEYGLTSLLDYPPFELPELDLDLSTPWAVTARARLDAASA